MEPQWPLILFTTLVAWACGLFATTGALALGGQARRSQPHALITSIVLLAASGITVFFHLQHWERIFNGFGHITSGITQELIAIVAFVIVAVVYFVALRKSEEQGGVAKWLAILAIAISVILAAVCAHSYMMPARPAWNSILEVLSIIGAACILGPATMAVIMAVREDELSPIGRFAIIGSAIGAACTIAYGAFLQMCGNGFNQVGFYFDPTHPTKAMADAAAAASSQVPLIWLGAVIIGAAVPLACSFIAKKKGNATSWKVLGTVSVVAGLAGAICLRLVFYSMGMSSFLYY